MIRRAAAPWLLCALAASSPLASVGCSADAPGSAEDDFSSAQATLLDFEFDGQLLADSSWNDEDTIQDQLLYTIGHLNTDKSVGRLDKLVLSKVTKTQENGRTRIAYHAKLPVAWGSKTNLPTEYALSLPLDVGSRALEAFTAKHKDTCTDFGAHDVDASSMWYYYRPRQARCAIGAEELFETKATVTKSPENTAGKYPEYHRIWEDGVFDVVAIFGKYEDGATTGDAGISAYNEFVAAMKRELEPGGVVTTPADVPNAPGVGSPDITFEATLSGGRKVKVTALLVDNVRTAGPAFDARYTALSTSADLVAYNGHAGLGQNVRALAGKGHFAKGKYQVFFMNGCDTFAYVDGSLAETRARLNTDDPTGTKYMEFVTNAMPAFFHQMPEATLALFRGILSVDAPRTYDAMFAEVDRAQVIVVTGEEDNVFAPGMPVMGTGGGGGGGQVEPPKALFAETGTVARDEEKAFAYPVEPGTYRIALEGAGDADLYVRRGEAPTTKLYDCRPYKAGSAEECSVAVEAPGTLHVTVRGWAPTSSFTVTGTKS